MLVAKGCQPGIFSELNIIFGGSQFDSTPRQTIGFACFHSVCDLKADFNSLHFPWSIPSHVYFACETFYA